MGQLSFWMFLGPFVHGLGTVTICSQPLAWDWGWRELAFGARVFVSSELLAGIQGSAWALSVKRLKMEQMLYLKKELSQWFKCFGYKWVVFLPFSGRLKGIFLCYRGRNLFYSYRLQSSSWLPDLHWTLLRVDKYLVLLPGLNGLSGLRITVRGRTWWKPGAHWGASSTQDLQRLFILHRCQSIWKTKTLPLH